MSAQTMLREATGLNLSKSIVDRAIKNRMQQTAAADPDAYLAALTPAELTQLIELVVVPESWMFRDAQAFQAAPSNSSRRAPPPAGRRASCPSRAPAARNPIRSRWRCSTPAWRATPS